MNLTKLGFISKRYVGERGWNCKMLGYGRAEFLKLWF